MSRRKLEELLKEPTKKNPRGLSKDIPDGMNERFPSKYNP